LSFVAYCIIVLLTVIIDQWSKFLVVESLQLYQSVPIVPGLFNLVYVTNSGAAFSLLADFDSPWRHYFFLTVGTLAVIGISYTAWKLAPISRVYPWALGLIAGGAIGNLIDRIRVGAVVDFLDFFIGRYHWPAFNVADSAICIGALTFLVINLLEARAQNIKEHV
jgi:signal peptidase II